MSKAEADIESIEDETVLEELVSILFRYLNLFCRADLHEVIIVIL